MPATFISYRRDDAAGYAGRLHEALERRLGEGQIFRDIDTLEPGFDFVDAIGSRLRECRVFLAIIGREWLDARDAAGQRRLDQSHDYVRLEIAGALARPEVRVIPVLIEGATMPAPEALPENIRALARRHAMNLRDDAWDHDVDRLAGVIADVTKNSTAQPVSSATPPATVKSWFGGPAKAGHSGTALACGWCGSRRPRRVDRVPESGEWRRRVACRNGFLDSRNRLLECDRGIDPDAALWCRRTASC